MRGRGLILTITYVDYHVGWLVGQFGAVSHSRMVLFKNTTLRDFGDELLFDAL